MLAGVLGFLTASAFWPGLISAATAPRWAVMAAVSPLLLRPNPALLRPIFVATLGVWLGYAALSVWWAPDSLTALHELIHLTILAVIAILATGLARLDGLLTGLSIGVALSGIICAVQFLGWSPVEQAVGPAGLFYNRAILGETAAPLLVWCLLTRRGWLAIPLGVALLLCQSRVGLAVAGVVLLACYPRRVLLAALVIAVYAGIGWALDVLPVDIGKLYSAIQRLAIWRVTLTALPLEGHGIGAFSAHFPHWEYAHSDVLQSLYELGLATVAPLVLGVLAFEAPGGRAEKATLAVVALEACVSFPLHMPATGFIFAVLTGWLGCRRPHLRDVYDARRDPVSVGA
jgi:hypothetical protein